MKEDKTPDQDDSNLNSSTAEEVREDPSGDMIATTPLRYTDVATGSCCSHSVVPRVDVDGQIDVRSPLYETF